MSNIKDFKITDTAGKKVADLPGSTLSGTIEQNKEAFDKLGELIIDHVNDSMDYLYDKGVDNVAEGVQQVDAKADAIDNKAIKNADDIAAVNTRVDYLQSCVGTPLVAATVAGMTDHDKIYVYTGSEAGYTAGDWYYWDGAAWTDGGVYNSVAFNTDTTLTLSGRAADAKVTGDEITDLKEDIDYLSQVKDTTEKDALLSLNEINMGWEIGAFQIDGTEVSLNTRVRSTLYVNTDKPVVVKSTPEVEYRVLYYNSANIASFSHISDAFISGITLLDKGYYARFVLRDALHPTVAVTDTYAIFNNFKICEVNGYNQPLDINDGIISKKIVTPEIHNRACWKNNNGIAEVVAIADSTVMYADEINVSQNDVYEVISTQGGADSARIWYVTDDAYNVLSESPHKKNLGVQTPCTEIVKIPTNGTKLLVNAIIKNTTLASTNLLPIIYKRAYISGRNGLSTNLFSYDNAYYNIWISNTGVENTYGGAFISGYINVKPNEEYVAAITKNVCIEAIEITWWDSAKTFISRDIDVASGVKIAKELKVTSPNTAAYAKVGFLPASNNTFISFPYGIAEEYGCTFMPYAEYIPHKHISNILDYSPRALYNAAYKNEYNDNVDSEYDGKIISILGDSISTFAGYGASSASDGHLIADGKYTYPGNHCRYPQNGLLQSVHDTYWMRLIETLKMKLGINDSIAGSRVSWDGTSPAGYPELGADGYISCMTRIGHLGENGTPNVILVNGGTNDIGQNMPIGTFNTESPVDYTEEQIQALPVATFADAYRTLLIRLQYYYPTATVVCLLPNYTTSYYSPTKVDKYCEIIKEACDFFGVKWIDMRASGITMFNRGTYLPDGIHYNTNGMEVIYENILRFFKYDLTVLN